MQGRRVAPGKGEGRLGLVAHVVDVAAASRREGVGVELEQAGRTAVGRLRVAGAFLQGELVEIGGFIRRGVHGSGGGAHLVAYRSRQGGRGSSGSSGAGPAVRDLWGRAHTTARTGQGGLRHRLAAGRDHHKLVLGILAGELVLRRQGGRHDRFQPLIAEILALDLLQGCGRPSRRLRDVQGLGPPLRDHLGLSGRIGVWRHGDVGHQRASHRAGRLELFGGFRLLFGARRGPELLDGHHLVG